MSDTYLHKHKGKHNNGLLEETPQSLQNMWDRHNNDIGEFKDLKNKLVDKIAQKELKEQIKTDEYNFKQNGEFIKDIDDPYYTARDGKV